MYMRNHFNSIVNQNYILIKIKKYSNKVHCKFSTMMQSPLYKLCKFIKTQNWGQSGGALHMLA